MINNSAISSVMDIDEIYIGETPFSVMARVAMQLGRESISNSIVAITELVKNAYDADAENVTIRFSGLDTDEPLLVIEDDGNGMTEGQLKEQWMVIGTPFKLLSARSYQKGRILTGEKGLGRLGLDRLCEQTVIKTFSEHEAKGTKLVINWDKYEKLDEKLENITHSYYSILKHASDPITQISHEITKGTQLILYGLKDVWTKDFLKDLKQELTLLVSPFSGINDFSIEIDTGENLPEVDGKIGSKYMLQAAEWKIVSMIDKNGNVSHNISSEQHEELFEYGPTSWNKLFRQSSNLLPQCGSLKFEFYFFPRKGVKVEDLTFSRTQIADFLDTNQGVRIYRDHFRVKPYGEPDGNGDWLNLSYERQRSPQGVAQKPLGGWRVGYNQIIGAVFISREKNSALIDQTNRESIVEGSAFFDLRIFAINAVKFFEFSRQKFEMAQKKETGYEQAREKVEKSTESSANTVKQVKTLTDEIQQQIKEGNTPKVDTIDTLARTVQQLEKSVDTFQKDQRNFTKVAEEKQAELERQKNTLGNLASLGILATSFGHETQGASNVVLTNAQDLKQDMEAGLFMVTPDTRIDIEDELRIMIYEADKIETFAKFMLRNVRRDKRTRRKVYLNQVIDRVFTSVEKYLDEKKIQVIGLRSLPEKISPILAYEIDWESIFINLITNAVYALENKEAGNRKIRVDMEESNGELQIKFADSGIGIETGNINQIFLPTVSTKRNTKGDIVGTGMGLAIVKDFVMAHVAGVIKVESPCDLGGAQFLIKVSIPDIAGRGN
ncbi:sensor histidine kinase [Anaerolineales bacterium HSG6]|nr:sensor histidine kinase [Anaerolineales bacterium HSG6]